MERILQNAGVAKENTPSLKLINGKIIIVILLTIVTISSLNLQPAIADAGEVYDDAFFTSQFDTIHEIDLNTIANSTTAYPGYTVTGTAIIFNNANDTNIYDPEIAYRLIGTTSRYINVAVAPESGEESVNLILSGMKAPSLSVGSANVSLWLADETTNSFIVPSAGPSEATPAGICVPITGTLNIYGSAHSDKSKIGELTAKAADRASHTTPRFAGAGGAAGIGGDGSAGSDGTAPGCGTVNIFGGVITARGGEGARAVMTYPSDLYGTGGGGAGIGGAGGTGASSSSTKAINGGDGGNITISGKAIVDARGNKGAAGIGGGNGGGQYLTSGIHLIENGGTGGGGGTIRIIEEADVTAVGMTGIGGGKHGESDRDILGTAATVFIDNTTIVRAYTTTNKFSAIQGTNDENQSQIPAYVITGRFGAAFTGTNPKIRVYNLENEVTSPPETPTDGLRFTLPFPTNAWSLSFAFTAPDQDAEHDYICIADQDGISAHVVRLNSSGVVGALGTSKDSTSHQYDIRSGLQLAGINRWLMKKVIITFHRNGGAFNPEIPNQSRYAGEKVIKPDTIPTRAGYVFMGWYTGTSVTASNPALNRWDFDTMTVGTSNLTLYAGWLASRTVTFNANGGQFSSGSATLQTVVGTGTTVSPPDEVPTRDNYKFTGWYTTTAATTPFNFSTSITGNLTIYAGWAPLCTVTFDSNGGETPDPPEQAIGFGEKVERPLDPTRTGYTFVGWFKTGDSEIWDFDTEVAISHADNTTIPYTMKLTAKWKGGDVNLHVRQIVVEKKSSLALPKAGYLTMTSGNQRFNLTVHSGSDITATDNYTVYRLARESQPFTIQAILPSYYKPHNLGYTMTTTAAENPASAYRAGILDLDSMEFAMVEDIYITVYITPVASNASDPGGWYEKPYSWAYR